MRYVQHVNRSRLEDFAREYWYELLIGALGVSAVIELIVPPSAPSSSRWFAVPALTVLMLPLFTRRWFPFGAPAAYWILAAAVSFIDGLLIPSIESLFLVGLASAALLGNLRDARKAGPAWRSCSQASRVVYNIPGHATAELILIPVEFGITWAVGFALRARSEQAEAAETRAERAERERDAAARIAVAEERSRIARELHDVVAHAVSVMVLQVGAVRHKLPKRRPTTVRRCAASSVPAAQP